jgi:hypothetical protein
MFARVSLRGSVHCLADITTATVFLCGEGNRSTCWPRQKELLEHLHEYKCSATDMSRTPNIYVLSLYKHTTQKVYICDPQMQLNNFFTLPKTFHYMFRPLWAIFK